MKIRVLVQSPHTLKATARSTGSSIEMSPHRQAAGIKGAGGKSIGGQFKAHEASEPGFSLESTGLSRHEPAPTSREAAVRSRKQAAAAKSLMEAYPDVVAARFVDIGSMYLESPNGMRMANPDYDPQPGSNVHTFRRFELRNVLLADGSFADEDNQPQFTDRDDVERLADSFRGHADVVFDPQDDDENCVDELYKDHFHNQQVFFRQLVDDAEPRRLEVDEFGVYRDMDERGRLVNNVTDKEKKALGERTPEAAINEHAAKLIKQNGKKRALEMMRRETLSNPDLSKPYGKIAKAIEKLPDRKIWGLF
jgi:hypothetical protein